MIRFVTILLLSSALLAAGEEKKWRWGDGGDTSRQDREVQPSGRSNDYLRGPSARYEIFENIDGGHPGHPHDFRPPIDYQRPGPGPGFGAGFVPGRPGAGVGGLYGNGGYGQGGYGGGILTGPREPPYQDFDKCKCTEKFNCRGVSYGNCDVGKKYCCYNTHDLQGGLVDPGLGVRPPYGGPDYPPGPGHGGPGVLVGPGGPTGIVGRPPGQGYGAGPGVLVGQGGPTGVGVRPGYGGPGVFGGPGGPTGVGVRPGYGGPGGHIGVDGRPGYGGGAVLVGPGGPTGVVGRPPGGYGGGFGGPGVLVGLGAGGYRPSAFGLGRSAKDVSIQNDGSNEKE